ncbi:hypothetical protein SAMN02910418_00024 [Bowdeniella nasicola]|uniref:DUF4440 domain-containing protein n=1 Tax=Bowdeniella nasicola TaxID=208480 RepID=A0A1H3VF88_9ACTO|nr:DUF4440 domain-containing protein [Bowdeniella nasicola]SDZ73455.1 hypothetical protein SAMN02910418_00024 [Bowdeniella nasicola]
MIALSRGRDRLITLAWRGEEELLSPRVRRDSELFRQFLADDFREIGRSGRRWNRDEIIAELVTEESSLTDAVLSEPEAQVIAHGIVLLSYRLQLGQQHSRHSSLWRVSENSAQCIFHQGTPASDC